MIDSNLSWKYHIESICHKISKSIGIIAKIRYYAPRRVLRRGITIMYNRQEIYNKEQEFLLTKNLPNWYLLSHVWFLF